jgi:hypothetical protein
MHAYMQENNHRDPEIQLNGRRLLEIKDTHKILGSTFDSRLTSWKAHINETRAKAFRRINLLKYLAGMKSGAGHEMMVLSALEYGSAAYRSASNAQLKRLEPVHNKGLRIAQNRKHVRVRIREPRQEAKNHMHSNSRSGK